MNSYPKIYSLSTVGIRQHNNADYLLHEVRTDFTGDNGLGKSIIADLMQLIFIPKRDFWKPGTEGVDRNERRIEGIPLNKDYIQHAYTFLNVERYQGRYVAIGVFIPKNSRLPVRPFIVQKSPDFEGRTLISFDHPLKALDFIAENRQVYDLADLKKHLQEKHGLYLREFFQSEEINFYYELLYKNQIIPVDLTKETNLKTYAKILQSFSRAKTLDINKSRSLQDFLFEENDDIKRLFDEQKDLLVGYIRQYNKNRTVIKELDFKQTKLSGLKTLHDKYQEAKTEFLKIDAILASLTYFDTKKLVEENKHRLEHAQKNFQKNHAETVAKTDNILKLFKEGQAICTILKEQNEKLLPALSDAKIDEKRNEANKLWALVNELEKAEPVFKKYKNVKAIQTKLKEQEGVKEQKKKLDKLKAISLFTAFEQSEWAKDFKKAYDHYQAKLTALQQQIAELKHLTELYDTSAADSLLYWAVDQKKPLTLAQESILMHLKDVVLKKPKKADSGFKYTTNPKELLNSFEEEKTGVWLVAGELREFIPFIQKQKFDNAKTLKSAIDKDKEEIKATLAAAQKELETINTLNRELTNVGYNAELFEVYKNRKQVEAFEMDELLNDAVVRIIKENSEDLDNFDVIKSKYKAINDEAVSLAKRQTELSIELEQIMRDISRYDAEIKKQAKDYKEPKDSVANLRKLRGDDLKDLKHQIESQLQLVLADKEIAERSVIAAEGVIASCKDRDKQLMAELNKHKALFDEKRNVLENDTNLKFEDVLQFGDFNDKMLKKLEVEYTATRRVYEEEFTRIAQSFEETKDQKNPELETDKFNFYTLVRILCGKLGLEGLAPELGKLNEELKKFGDLQLNIIVNVFTQVEKQYNALKRLVTELNFFFSENKISNGYQFRIDFNDRKDIAIDWISKMRELAKVQSFGADLFTDKQVADNKENSPDLFIVNLAQTFSAVKNCELEDLLNPKFYFELKVGLYDDKNTRYSGSGGQAYTALALLCIGRLSVIQRDKNRPGVKFIIIEELSNIDDTNFNLFPQIAEQFGYQLLTMTPKPFGTYTDDTWFLHMLVRGKDKDINYQPMSFFKTKNSKKLLEDHLADLPKIAEN